MINKECADWRDIKHVNSDYKQTEMMVKCMQQDCEQSMEGGNANQASELGCRFLDPNGFCYINGALQLWCATEGKGNVWCNDGGEDWAPVRETERESESEIERGYEGERERASERGNEEKTEMAARIGRRQAVAGGPVV